MSLATKPNTSELLPEPDTPVNTVSRRFGSSMLTSLRLFTRAPCTRIMSWLSAACACFAFGVAIGAQRTSLIRIVLPAGSRNAQSRIPYG